MFALISNLIHQGPDDTETAAPFEFSGAFRIWRYGHRSFKVDWCSAIDDLELDKIGPKLHAHCYLPVSLMMVGMLDSIVHCFNDGQFHFESCLIANGKRSRDTVYRKADQKYVSKLAFDGKRDFSGSQRGKGITVPHSAAKRRNCHLLVGEYAKDFVQPGQAEDTHYGSTRTAYD